MLFSNGINTSSSNVIVSKLIFSGMNNSFIFIMVNEGGYI